MSTDLCCKILRSLGYDQATVLALVNLIEKWTQHSGEEWTVKRLKALKQDFILLKAGHRKSSDWISYGKDGLPKGPFRKIFKLGLATKSGKQLARALVALTSYHRFYAKRVTVAQRKKFILSATQSEGTEPSPWELDSMPSFTFFTGLCKAKYKRVCQDSPSELAEHWRYIPLNPRRRVPTFCSGMVPEDQIENWIDDNFCFAREFLYQFRDTPLYKFFMILTKADQAPEVPSEYTYVGRVSCIQETGYKLRAVGNPNRVIQMFLEPLKLSVMSVLRRLEQDCTYDQFSGVQWAQDKLKLGQMLYTYDISDASNHMSRHTQVSICNDIFQDRLKELTLFYKVSGSQWMCDTSLDKSGRLSFNQGQPLGLGPSFGMFALYHHWLVYESASRVGIPLDKVSQLYRMIGDDIVISSTKLAHSYLEVLSNYNIPISTSKSIYGSTTLCEFAGMVITRNTIVPSFKWREVSDSNFLLLAKALGSRSTKIFRPLQQAMISLVKEIPEKYGGLGWNPKGLSSFSRLRDNFYVIKALAEHAPQPYHAIALRIYDALVELSAARTGLVTLPEDLSKQLQDSAPRPEEAIVLQEFIDALHGIRDDVSDIELRQYSVGSTSDPRGPSTLSVMLAKILSGSGQEEVFQKLRDLGLMDDTRTVTARVDSYVESKLRKEEIPIQSEQPRLRRR